MEEGGERSRRLFPERRPPSIHFLYFVVNLVGDQSPMLSLISLDSADFIEQIYT